MRLSQLSLVNWVFAQQRGKGVTCIVERCLARRNFRNSHELPLLQSSEHANFFRTTYKTKYINIKDISILVLR